MCKSLSKLLFSDNISLSPASKISYNIKEKNYIGDTCSNLLIHSIRLTCFSPIPIYADYSMFAFQLISFC